MPTPESARNDRPKPPLAPRRRQSLRAAAASVPAGRWGVAVSGGADSTALFHLMQRRRDVELVVIHVDHQMRREASTADAAFVTKTAHEAGVALYLRRREELETLSPGQRRVTSEYLRALRLRVYREAQEHSLLSGVLLAHHADDVAETLLMRLLRGSPRSGTLGLAPLRFEQTVGGVRLLRPLLGVRRMRLRRFLERTQRVWREDASNALDVSLRNRVRRLLKDRGAVAERLLALAENAATAEALLEAATPALEASPRLVDLAALPSPIRRRAARRWLTEQGLPESAAGPQAVDAVLAMVDAAGPRAADLAGGIRIERRGGRLWLGAKRGPTMD